MSPARREQRKLDTVALARQYAATSEQAVKVFEVLLTEEGLAYYLTNDPGGEPCYATLVEGESFKKSYENLEELLPAGTELREVYRATPPQWN